MANYPKPHFVKFKGKWQACYGNQCKGSKFRVQMVIAEDVNIFIAHCKYLEELDPQSNIKSRLATERGGTSNMSRIAAILRHIRGFM